MQTIWQICLKKLAEKINKIVIGQARVYITLYIIGKQYPFFVNIHKKKVFISIYKYLCQIRGVSFVGEGLFYFQEIYLVLYELRTDFSDSNSKRRHLHSRNAGNAHLARVSGNNLHL